METGEFLEPILRLFRIWKIRRYIKKDARVLDIGCGTKAKFLLDLSPYIKEGVGIDVGATPFTEKNISVLNSDIDGKSFPVADHSFDFVIMLAALEHFNNREFVASEIRRVLKPGGVLLMTVPSWAAKPVLEFLAYKLKIVSREGVQDHKTYFWKKDLMFLLKNAGFTDIKHKYFQFYLNNFIHATK